MIAELDPNYPLSSMFNKDTWDSGLPVPSASFPALVRVTDPCCQQEQHKCSLIRFCSQPLLGLLQFCSLKQAKTAEIAKICFYHEDMSLPRVPLLPRAEHSEPQHITKGKRTGHCCCMWWWKGSREPRLGVVPGAQTARAERYAEHSRCGISSTCAHKGLQ